MGTLLVLDADVETYMEDSNFIVGDRVHASTASSSVTLYGALHPGTNPLRMGVFDKQLADTQKVLHIAGDGSTVAFDDDDYAPLANAHVDEDPLDSADRLRVIVQEIGSRNQVLRTLTRVAADDTPADGEFKTSGATVLTVGAALAEGAYFRILILDDEDLETQDLDQYVPNLVSVYDFMFADDDTVLERF